MSIKFAQFSIPLPRVCEMLLYTPLGVHGTVCTGAYTKRKIAQFEKRFEEE